MDKIFVDSVLVQSDEKNTVHLYIDGVEKKNILAIEIEETPGLEDKLVRVTEYVVSKNVEFDVASNIESKTLGMVRLAKGYNTIKVYSAGY